MKLKKLYMPVICYLTLAAFICVISIAASYSKQEHRRTEVSTSASLSNASLNLAPEEDRNGNALMLDTLLACVFFLPLVLLASYLLNFRPVYYAPRTTYPSFKVPLVVSLRALRL